MADGEEWLLARVIFRAGAAPLTSPDVDDPLDELFDRLALGESLPLRDVWLAARALLLENYDLSDSEVAELLGVAHGGESQALAEAVLECLFGRRSDARGYGGWIRASLAANGLNAPISSRELTSVMALLVATNRTVPLERFADACRAARERSMLDRVL